MKFLILGSPHRNLLCGEQNYSVNLIYIWLSRENQKIYFKTTLVLNQETNEEEDNSVNKITSLCHMLYTITKIKITVNGIYFNSYTESAL